jgi:hypothetical protein
MASTVTIGNKTFEVEHKEAGRTLDLGNGPIDRSYYQLTGPRGAVWGLLRNIEQPDMLYPMNFTHISGKCRPLCGFNWFTDRNGGIEPVR